MINYNHLPKHSAFFHGALYQRRNEDLQLAGMSQRTVHGYLRAVRQVSLRTGQKRSPISSPNRNCGDTSCTSRMRINSLTAVFASPYRASNSSARERASVTGKRWQR